MVDRESQAMIVAGNEAERQERPDYTADFLQLLKDFGDGAQNGRELKKNLGEIDGPDGPMSIDLVLTPNPGEKPRLGAWLSGENAVMSYDIDLHARNLGEAYGPDYADVLMTSSHSTQSKRGRPTISMAGSIPNAEFADVSAQVDASIARAAAITYDKDVVSTQIVEYDQEDLLKRLIAEGYVERPGFPRVYDKLYGRPGREAVILPVKPKPAENRSERPAITDANPGLTSDAAMEAMRRLDRSANWDLSTTVTKQTEAYGLLTIATKLRKVPSRGPASVPPKVDVVFTAGTNTGTMKIECFDNGDDIDVSRRDIAWGEQKNTDADPLDAPLDTTLGDESFAAYAAVLEGLADYKRKPVRDGIMIQGSNEAEATLLEARGYRPDADISRGTNIYYRRLFGSFEEA